MSIKSKLLATAATLTMVGGIGTAGVLGTAATANAATPSCGTSCVDLFSYEFGHHFTPGFVLDVYRQHIRIGQPVILFRAANDDLAEDFQATLQGTVADFYAAQMVSAATALHYGCVAGTGAAEFPSCIAPASVNDYAFEVQYTPNGVQSGLCAGLASNAVSQEGVTLQECGVSARTIWIIDQADSSTGRLTPILTEYVPLINGSSSNFSQPFVLTFPQNGYPTDRPRPQLQVDNLTGYTNPGTGDPAGVDSNQLFGADFGPYVFEI